MKLFRAIIREQDALVKELNRLNEHETLALIAISIVRKILASARIALQRRRLRSLPWDCGS